ncbi:hypothetical protein FACS189426_13630 [Bacteroidia bacterium]|nr:hypothetical protein FACS189426_13630 [Bacteroidia bacterium]GHT86120.1 hypothetical protein FACS18947_5690 [Bacteroidia bacterium]GHV70469.1 hypothetical protein FACS189420_1690 [Bacteroidia bacterium]
MAENERLKKVIFWLISQGIVKTQEDLAFQLGYNPSSVSQIVTGLKPLSKKFANKIGKFSDKININYLFGEGEMLIENYHGESKTTSLTEVQPNEITILLQIIQSQQKQLESQQRTIEILVGTIGNKKE